MNDSWNYLTVKFWIDEISSKSINKIKDETREWRQERNIGSKVHTFTQTSHLEELEEDCPVATPDEELHKEAYVSQTTNNSVESSEPKKMGRKGKNQK